MMDQATRMLERMIGCHKKALELLRAQNGPASMIRYTERAIQNYEEQLARLKAQSEEIRRDGRAV